MPDVVAITIIIIIIIIIFFFFFFFLCRLCRSVETECVSVFLLLQVCFLYYRAPIPTQKSTFEQSHSMFHHKRSL